MKKGNTMKTAKRFLIWSMAAIVFGVVMSTQNTIMATDAKLIQVSPIGKEKTVGLDVDPAEVKVKMNTIVIWLSAVQDSEIKIEFADGKKCKSVTAHADGFNLDQDRWCYVTSYVPFAGSSTLQFTDKGTYRYTIYTKDGVSAIGKIMVE